MYKNILVPVELGHDESTHQAIDVARELRAKEGEITFLNVIEELPGYATQYVPTEIRKSALQETETYLASLEGEVPASKSLVIQGHSARSILDFADDHGIDCIVIASHKPGVPDYFLGGTAARVVRHAKCAVHVVR
ncbi:MAG: universal stress protein [Litoreibacter sp.]|nr:universal stress protein [Litoreibacter sp.]